jgi:hypothetical protein
VRDLHASIDYYLIQLGFKLNWEAPNVAEVSRDRCGIMLSEGDQGNPGSWLWIGVGDAECCMKNIARPGPTSAFRPPIITGLSKCKRKTWMAMCFALARNRRRANRFGERLDMHVTRWAPAGDRGWRRVEEH